MKHTTETLHNMLCSALEEIAEKGTMSVGELDALYKLIIAREKLLRIEEIEAGMEHLHDDSYGRKRYSRRYSKGEHHETMVHKLREMLEDPNLTHGERATIHHAIEIMER